jgi:type I restriction enzyme S subunit
MSSSVTTNFEESVYLNSFSFGVRFNEDIQLIPEFSKYLFRSKFMRTEISRTASGVTRYNVSKARFKKLTIPIPPLNVQTEIARILDTFAEITAELTAELTARKTQYNYYREQLLSFDEGEVEWKTLGEVGEIKRGVAFTKKQAVFGRFPVVANASEPICFHNELNRNGEFIVIARSGANAGLISYWNEELFLTDAFSIHPNDSVLNTKFAFYFLKKHQREIHLMKEGSGVPHVRASDFEIYKIPVPSLEEQARIVSILDKFDTLTTSISEGLPKEIELRKKQYEYYRDMLLNFNKLNIDDEKR